MEENWNAIFKFCEMFQKFKMRNLDTPLRPQNEYAELRRKLEEDGGLRSPGFNSN